MIAWLMACSLPMASTQELEGLHGFAMEARGRTMAGMAAVSVGDGPWRLDALLPTGTALFSVEVSDGEVQLESSDPDLAGVLKRLPFERDLAAMMRYRCDAPRCRAGRHRLITVDERTWKVRGPGGPARVTREQNTWMLADPIRGYTLRVVIP
ncbi:MAG: hypothetical protein KTR31_01650 [Myxococcales bacterium]|nr:hypothetical protein [Myxococcales bacterium]